MLTLNEWPGISLGNGFIQKLFKTIAVQGIWSSGKPVQVLKNREGILLHGSGGWISYYKQEFSFGAP